MDGPHSGRQPRGPLAVHNRAVFKRLMQTFDREKGSGTVNAARHSNPAFDALIDKAAVTIDVAERTAIFRDFQKEVGAKLPLINVAEWGFITVARDSVHNVSNNPRWAVSNWADTWIDG